MTFPGPVPGPRPQTGREIPTRPAAPGAPWATDLAAPASAAGASADRATGTTAAPAIDALANTTGHPEVDAVLVALVDVADAPPVEQVALYTEAHHRLQQTLRDIDAT